jgi:radical SAM protein with 4Fe4S-binding SPASM domain
MNTFNLFKKIIDLKINKKTNDEVEISEFIKNNESFCMIPWTNLNISPNADVCACDLMIKSKDVVLGNINNDSLEDIWNSKKIKDIRLKMLEGRKTKECLRCYSQEKINKNFNSRRKHFNEQYFMKYKNIVESTKIDGTVENLNIVYLDFRFNNKCNFSCRTCTPYYSSSWEKKLNINIPKINNVTEIIKKTKQIILEDKLQEIYFAGGEALITDEHWEIINFLIENKKNNITLRYNTNLSVLNYKGNNFLEKMKNFNKIIISPSCDSLGIRGEYIRTGFSNKIFLKNINLLKQNNYQYFISTVISFFNIIYLYDFLNDLKNNDIYYDNINFITIIKGFYSIYNLPLEMLDVISKEIEKIIKSDFITQNKKEYLLSLYYSIKKNNSFNETEFKKNIDYIKHQDSLNKLKFENCFPEMYNLISKYF